MIKAQPELKILWLGLDHSQPLGRGECDEDRRGLSSLTELRELLRRCQLLFCNDTGMMHLAEDQGVPVAAVFGPTTVELGFGQDEAQSRVVEKPLWCRPCSKNGSKCHRLVNRQACLKAVRVEDALAVITPMLTKQRPRDSLTLS
jgi:heptosyltransferase-2